MIFPVNPENLSGPGFPQVGYLVAITACTVSPLHELLHQAVPDVTGVHGLLR